MYVLPENFHEDIMIQDQKSILNSLFAEYACTKVMHVQVS